MNIYRDYAEELIEAGYSVTPTEQSKAPLLHKGWNTTTGDAILAPKYDKFWHKAQGLGLLCGEPSGIICLDIDIEDTASPELLAIRNEIEALLPPTFSGRAGSKIKVHSRLYKFNGERTRIFPKISVELLSTGRQCVLPPSLHPQGHPYRWVGSPIQECAPDDFPDLPVGIIEKLEKWNEEAKDFLKDQDKKDRKAGKVGVVENSELESGRCRHGSNNVIGEMLTAMCLDDCDIDAAIKKALAKDSDYNLNSDFTFFNCPTRRWKDISTREDNAAIEAKGIWKRYENSDDLKAMYKAEKLEKQKAEFTNKPIDEKYPTMKDGFHFKIEPPEGSKAKVKWVPDFDGLALYMSNVPKMRFSDSVGYLWDGRHFEKTPGKIITKEVDALVRKNTHPSTVSAFVQKAEAKNTLRAKHFKTPDGFMNCNNGILDVATGNFAPHTPEFNFKYALDHDFEPSADCLLFKRALDVVTCGDQDMVDLIGEMFGYCIMGGDPIAHKCFMLLGEGGNGKSVVNEALRSLVGESNFTTISLDKLNLPFSAVRLKDKLANIIDETPVFSRDALEGFKNLVSGGYFSAAQKGKDEFELKAQARLVIACNKAPSFGNAGHAVTRRIIIIPFDRPVDGAGVDLFINDKIAAEMSGVLNFALEGLSRLRNNHYKFTQARRSVAALDEYRVDNDRVLEFLDREVEINVADNKAGETFADLFEAYVFMCKTNGYKNHQSKSAFAQNFKRHYVKALENLGVVPVDNHFRDRHGARYKYTRIRQVFRKRDLELRNLFPGA